MGTAGGGCALPRIPFALYSQCSAAFLGGRSRRQPRHTPTTVHAFMLLCLPPSPACRSLPGPGFGASPTILFTLMEERGEVAVAAESSEDEADVPLGASRRSSHFMSEFGSLRFGSLGAASLPSEDDKAKPPRARLPSEGSEESSDSDSSSDEEGEGEENDLPFQLDP